MKDSYLLRLPLGKLRELKQKALDSRVSLNQYINTKLSSSIDEEANTSSELIKTIINSSIGNRIEAMILFGSVAKNISTKSSDFDLLIVMKEKEKISRSLYTLWDNEIEPNLRLEMSDGKIISPHFVNISLNLEDIHSLWLEVAISGKILWKINNTIDILLQKIRLSIAHNQFTRKLSHGQPYWIRNTDKKL